MMLDLSWFVFGVMMAQAPRPTVSGRLFKDLTWADVIKKSEKCSRCTPVRPCMVDAMPKLPVTNNFDLEYAEFLTDDELNAKYNGEKDFCDCTSDMWGGDHWRETPKRGCGEAQNQLCEGKSDCGENLPCVPYTFSYVCTCKNPTDFSQRCNRPGAKKYEYFEKPTIIPFMTSPTFAPYQSDWFRGIITIMPGSTGWSFCLHYQFGDGRDFCAMHSFDDDPSIWHRSVKEFKPLKTEYNTKEECLKDIDKKIHFLDKYLCDLIPEGVNFRVFVPFDHWFRVDLNPNNPDAVMIPGDPLPVGRKFKMRLVGSNGLEDGKGGAPEEYHFRVQTWRFSRGDDTPEPLPFIGFYQLQFRQCTFIFTYTGCSVEQTNQPIYNQYKEIVIHAFRNQHPGTTGCPTMVPVDNRWILEPGTDTFRYRNPDVNVWTRNIEPFPLGEQQGSGIDDDSYIYKVSLEEFQQLLIYGGDDEFNIVVTHDYVQQGHPRAHVSTEQGLHYQTRNLCYFSLKKILVIILPVSEFISQSCDDAIGGIELKITRPFYFEEALKIEWWCINPKDPSDPCTKVRTTGSQRDQFHEYRDFKYDEPMGCHDYTWQMKVYYEDRTEQSEMIYQIQVEREKENLPKIEMQSLTVINKTKNTVDPDEPNYFRIVTDPLLPDVWSWKLYKITDRLPSGAMNKELIPGEWQQAVSPTSTYICIIPPFKLVRDLEYVLIGKYKHGRASYTFTANSPPKDGSCTIKPDTGFTGVTKFRVRCENFIDEQGPLSYTVVESEGLDQMPWLQYTTFESGNTVESDVHIFSNELAALIFDDDGMHTRVELKVNLQDPPNDPKDINLFLSLELPKMVDNDKMKAVEEMAWFTRYFDKLKIPFEEDQKMAFIVALSKAVDFNSPPNVFERGIMVLRNLFISQLEINRTMTDQVLKAGGEQLHNFVDIFRGPYILNNMKYYDQNKTKEVVTYIAATILQQPDPIVIDDAIREDEHEAHKIRAAKGSYHALQALEYMGEARRSKQYFQLQPTYNSTQKNITMLVQVNNATTFNKEFSPVKIKGHTMTLPQETVDKYKEKPLFSVMITSEDNLFWWLPNDAGILSVTAEVDNGTSVGNNDWKPADGPFNIYLKLKDFKEKTEKMVGTTRAIPKCKGSLRKLNRAVTVHHLKVPKGEGVVYILFSQEVHGKIKVFAGSNPRPTYDLVSRRQPLTNELLTKNYSNLDTRRQSDFYVGILTADNDSVSIPYEMKYKIVQCTNFIYDRFEPTGCHYKGFLENRTDNPRIWCQCDHLSWFSANMFLPPQRIVLAEDIYLFSTIFDNFYVALLVALMLLLLVILLFWGRKKDRKDVMARYVTVLTDNWCSETYPYVVAVFTGERWSSGTTSRVCIRVFGKDGHSRVHLFSHHNRRVLKMGLDDWFLIKTKASLGPLTSIQLWHNHSGFAPEWYCQKVVVYDVKTQESFTFIVERWFTFDQRISLSDARMQQLELLKPEEESSKWQYYIAGWVFSELRDTHIWASIFTRHPRSLYTRCQRTVIAVGLVMSTMLASMMFFDFNPGPADLPAFQVNWSDIWTGIKGALIAIILQLLVVLCFEISKAKKTNKLTKQQRESTEKLSRASGADAKRDFVEVMKVLAPKPVPYEPVTLKTREGREKSKIAFIFLILAWILSVTVITICAFFITLYGLKFGTKKSLVWIVSFMSGIVTDSILLEPMKMILFAVLVSLLFRKSNVDTFVMEVKYEEVDRGIVEWRKCLRRMMETRLTSPYNPVSTKRINKIRARYGSRRVRYLIYYGIILLLLLIMTFLFVYAFGVKSSYYGLRQINFYFKNESNQLRTEQNMYDLVHHNVIPSLHRVYWYNEKAPLPLEVNEKKAKALDPRFASNVRGFMKDYTNKLVGVPRLRQLRVKPHNIVIARAFRVHYQQAYGKLFEYREETKSFMPEWIVLDKRNENVSQLWHYSFPVSTKTGHTQGRSGWVYSGGGYVVPLSWNRGNSWRIIQRLEMEKWADNRTRAVILEINLYNNNIKQFTEMRFIIEGLPTGNYMSRFQSRTTSFFFQKKPEAQMIVALSACMTVVLVALGFFVLVQISRDGFVVYFSQFRGYLDVLVIGLGLSCVSHFVSRALQFSLFLEDLDRAPQDVYTSLYSPFNIDEEAHIVFGVFTLIVVISTIFTIYQAVGFRKFHFVFSKIIGLLIAMIVINVTMTYLIHYASYSVDRTPMENFFLHSTLRDQQFLRTDDESDTRVLYVILFPVIIVLLKFNAACIIFFHLWYSDQTFSKTYLKSQGQLLPRGTGRLIRLKGRSQTTQEPSKDVLSLKVQKLRATFTLL